MSENTTTPAQAADLLITTGDGYGLQLAPSAEQQKASLLKHSALIVEIADPASDAAAENQLKKLADIRIALEKGRVAAKKPALDFGTKVDETAKAFLKELAEQEARLKKLRNDYATAVLKERQRVLAELEEKRAAEEKARAAAAKAEADAIAEKLRLEAEAKAKAEEAERLEWEGADAAKVDAAKVDAAKVEVRTIEVAVEAAAEVVAETAKVAVVEASPWGGGGGSFLPATPRGAKLVPSYEVEDIGKFYAVCPHLCTLEVKHAETLAFIKSQTIGDVPPVILGLKITMSAKVGR